VLDPNSGADDSAAPMPTRRRVLTGGGRGLLALALVGTAAAACGPSGPPRTDPLEAQLEAARRDSDLASAAATAVAPWLVPPELARAAGKPTPASTTAAAPAPSAPGANPAPPPTVQDVAIALRKSAESAAELVPALSGYRAGLLGSIAAACTASYTLGLTPPRSPARRPR